MQWDVVLNSLDSGEKKKMNENERKKKEAGSRCLALAEINKTSATHSLECHLSYSYQT